MKKILAITLCVLMIILSIPFSAVSAEEDLPIVYDSTASYDEAELVKICVNAYCDTYGFNLETDIERCDIIGQDSGYVVFKPFHHGVCPVQGSERIGNVVFWDLFINEGDVGYFTLSASGEVESLRDTHKKQLINIYELQKQVPESFVIYGVPDDNGYTPYLAWDKFYETYIGGVVGEEGVNKDESIQSFQYKELYCEYDNYNNTPKWMIVHGYPAFQLPWCSANYLVMNDIVIYHFPAGNGAFDLPYGIYDVDSDSFINFADAMSNPKFAELPETLKKIGVGEVIGDMDGDRELTVKDATFIQKAIAQMIEFPADDYILGRNGEFSVCAIGKELSYISDFNRDGNRDIKDATHIQKYIAYMT